MAVSTSSIFQNLSSILENQLLSNSSLDISSNGQIQKYGKLGEFANTRTFKSHIKTDRKTKR